MDIIYQERLELCYHQPVLDILRACDMDFVPPLSQRTSTHQSKLDHLDAPSADGPQAYFDELQNQPFVLALDGGKLVGFLSYIPDYTLGFLDDDVDDSYVSTICTLPERRGEGIGSRLYEYLEQVLSPNIISIRTWSTNTPQISLLKKRGYTLIRTIEDDRGTGVDTVYYIKRRSTHE